MTLTEKRSSDVHNPHHADVKVGLTSMWLLGVGGFIGGNFIGWPTILTGGFGSGLVSVIFFGFYFWMLGQVTGELSARFPQNGGTYMYSRRVFGEKVGSVAGILHLLKLISSNCCMALAISGYLVEVTTDSDWVQLGSWIGVYTFFTTVHCYGGYSSIYFNNFIVVMCLTVVLTYFVAASFEFDFKTNAIGDRGWFYKGFSGFVSGFPYGIWCMDGFEELPLAIDLAGEIGNAVPLALNICAATAISLSLGLLVLGGSSADHEDLMNTPAPLMMSFIDAWGENWFVIVGLDTAIILGLSISFSSFVLFTGRMVQVVASDGLLPHSLSETNSTFGTPINATIFSSSCGLLITTLFGVCFGIDKAEDALIACSLLTSVSCYMCNFCCLHTMLRTEEEIKVLNINDSNSQTWQMSQIQHSKAYNCVFGGEDPKNMRFFFGRRGTELGVLLSLFVMFSIFYLFAIEKNFHIGLFILCAVTIVTVLVVYLLTCILTEKKVHDDLVDLSTRSTTPLSTPA